MAKKKKTVVKQEIVEEVEYGSGDSSSSSSDEDNHNKNTNNSNDDIEDDLPPPKRKNRNHHPRARDAETNEELQRRILQQEKDLKMAKKMQQEMTDEELARRLAQAEERLAEAEEQNRANRIPNTWTLFRILSYFIPLAFIAIGAVALVYAMGGRDLEPVPMYPEGYNDSQATANPMGTNDDEYWGSGKNDEDPWQGMKPNQVNKWDTPSNDGLTLVLVNSLQDSWDHFFFKAMDDWDNGTPDSLTLTTSKSEHDFNCEAENGRLKVCNGNYGDTKWRGINQIVVSNNYIVASAARMNDYYLFTATNAQKQYTMCHEMGHGFGVPHSDEDFFNVDQGNCMDYTSNPDNNQSPNQMNYEFLNALYGTVGTGSAGMGDARTRRNMRTTNTPEQEQNTTTTTRIKQEETTQLPEWLQRKMKRAVRRLEQQVFQNTTTATSTITNTNDDPVDDNENTYDWEVLHSTEHGETHRLELGSGYSIQMHVLF